MKNLIIIAALFLVVSCTKENSKPIPVQATETSNSFGDTITLTPGVNTLHTWSGSFVSEKLRKVQFQVEGTILPTYDNIKLFINGGEVHATTTYEAGNITFAFSPRNSPLLNSNIKFELMAVTNEIQSVYRVKLFEVITSKQVMPLSVYSAYYK